MNYYQYTITSIHTIKDRFFGKIECDRTTILPMGTTKEDALKKYENMKKDKNYKNVVLYQQIYIHYEGEKEILKS